MKNFKLVLRVIFTLFYYPALVIHELSHAIMAVILFQIPIKIRFPFNFNRPLWGMVYFNESFKQLRFRAFLIYLAPLFSIIFFLGLSYFFHPIKYIVAYQIITYRYSLPSGDDIENCLFILGHHGRFRYFSYIQKWLYYKYFKVLEIRGDIKNTNQMFEDESAKYYNCYKYCNYHEKTIFFCKQAKKYSFTKYSKLKYLT